MRSLRFRAQDYFHCPFPSVASSPRFPSLRMVTCRYFPNLITQKLVLQRHLSLVCYASHVSPPSLPNSTLRPPTHHVKMLLFKSLHARSRGPETPTGPSISAARADSSNCDRSSPAGTLPSNPLQIHLLLAHTRS